MLAEGEYKIRQIRGTFSTAVSNGHVLSAADKREMQHQGIRIASLLIKLDDQWLSSQHQLVTAYKQIWCDDQYQVKLAVAAAVYHIPGSLPVSVGFVMAVTLR